MIQLAIQEPKIEQFFHHSQDEIMRALHYIVENNIQDFSLEQSTHQLSSAQKEELHSRLQSYHENRDIGRSWDDVKNEFNRSY